jgi:hypothetical protein
MTKIINVGDRVAFSAAFLRSTGQYTGDVPFLRGEVTGVSLDIPGCRLLIVEWDREWDRDASTVNAANLVLKTNIASESVL